MLDKKNIEDLELVEALDRVYTILYELSNEDYLDYDILVGGVDYYAFMNEDFDKQLTSSLKEGIFEFLDNIPLEDIHEAYGMNTEEFKVFLSPFIEDYHGDGIVKFKDGWEDNEILFKFTFLYMWEVDKYDKNIYKIKHYDEECWLGEDWLNKFHKKSDVVRDEIDNMIARYGKDFVLEQLKKVVE